MRQAATVRTNQLEGIPNIGKSIASDLRSLGILSPQQLAARDPLETYLALSDSMGNRHDPCVLYTLLAARHYLGSGESIPWWKFTAQGKKMFAAHPNGHGKYVAPDDETCHARSPHPNPDGTTSHSTRQPKYGSQVAGYPPEGEGANESLREFHIKHERK